MTLLTDPISTPSCLSAQTTETPDKASPPNSESFFVAAQEKEKFLSPAAQLQVHKVSEKVLIDDDDQQLEAPEANEDDIVDSSFEQDFHQGEDHLEDEGEEEDQMGPFHELFSVVDKFYETASMQSASFRESCCTAINAHHHNVVRLLLHERRRPDLLTFLPVHAFRPAWEMRSMTETSS